MPYVERTDSEIRQAFIRMLKKLPNQDKPSIGCMCHLLAPREMADLLERLEKGEKLDEALLRPLSAVDPEMIRTVLRS